MDLMEFLWWRRRYLLQYLFFLWIATIIKISDACSTRGAPKARSPVQVNLPGYAQSQSQSQSQQQHGPTPAVANNASIPHFNCPSTYQKWYCLNEASCFAVKIGDTILYNCRCAVGYQGQRCEYIDTDESYGPSRTRYMVKQAKIAGITTGAIFIVIIVITAITIYVRRRRELKLAEPAPSFEAFQRMPFGRTLSRTDQFNTGRSKSPTGGSLFTPIMMNASLSSGGSATATQTKVPEQEALFSRIVEKFRPAPVASTSDTTLSDRGQDEFLITVEPRGPQHTAQELPHPYSLAGNSPFVSNNSPHRTFTTGS